MTNIYKYRTALLVLIFLAAVNKCIAQPSFAGLEHLFTIPENYVVRFTNSPLAIDGILNEKAWEKASWSKDFVDIEGNKKPLPVWQTRMKMLWSDSALFIAAELTDPHIWATLAEHDDIIFRDNDFEIFLDPDNNTHEYYEIEVNAFNTIFDLFMPRPYRNMSGAMINWDLPGLRSGIHVEGSLNKSSDKDNSWSVEMAIPFRAMQVNNTKAPPKEGETWRINFSRVQWDTEIQDGKYVKSKDQSGRNKPEHNWVWSPQGVINMHYPERWGYLQFTRLPESEPVIFEMPYAEKQKNYLWLCYYRQKEYSGRNRTYATSLGELGIDTASLMVDSRPNNLKMEATSRQFTATITDDKNNSVSINDEGLIRYFKSRF